MTGPARPNPPIETRLDELLDHLVAGDELPATDDELEGLATLARAIRDDDRIEWPEPAFPGRLTASVHAELQPANGRITAEEDQEAEVWAEPAADPPDRLLTSIPASDIAELTGAASRSSRLRRYAQIAAAVAGFGLLTLVLVAVFRGFDDESPAAVGTGDEGRPPQLAVTMQTEPVGVNPDIFLVTLDGSDPVNLTDNPAVDTMPAWSPDGGKVAFISDRDGEDALYVMDADGGNVRQIYAPDPSEDWHLRNPAWSPDGSRIAVMRYALAPDSGIAHVVIAASGGSGQRIISMTEDYPQLAFDQTPTWSPDGEWIAFEVYNDEVHRIAVASMHSYLTQPLGFGSAPSWSRSGNIAFSNERDLTIATFVDDPLALNEVAKFALPVAQSISRPALSTDGSRLAFIANTAGGSSIWVFNSDGSDQVEVPDSGFSAYPIWSPDGKQLAFLRFGAFFSAESTGYELMVYDIENEILSSVVDTGFSGPLMGPPAWRPVATDDDTSTDATPTAPPVEPPDTPTATESAGEVLTPPVARLHGGIGSVEAYFGSYSWQFSDPDQTFAAIDAPRIPFTEDPLRVTAGEHLAVSIRGEEFSRPPVRTMIEVYNLAENEALQTGPAGRPAPDPQFTIRTEPVLRIEAEDPAGPTFTLTLPPDRYALVVRSDWGEHPNMPGEIFITWVFDVVVQEAADQPAILVDPGSWFCSDRLRMEASGFLPDEPVVVSVRNLETGATRAVGITPTANPDGEFTAELPISLMYPECETEATRPGGLRLQISMTTSGTGGNQIEASINIHVFVDDGGESGTSMDDPRVQQAIQQVRDFLSDPTAEFTVLPLEDDGAFTFVTLEQRDPNGPIPGGVFNSFVVEINQGAVFAATLGMNTTMARPSNPITVDEARALAETFHAGHDRFDGALSVIDEEAYVYINADEQTYGRTWQLQREGVRLPTQVRVNVSLATGLVYGYMRYDVPYDGPLTPGISEVEARQAAEQIIAENPEFAGATIRESRLEVWYSGADDTIEGHGAADPEMAWRLAWTFSLADRQSPATDHFLLIDALTGRKLEPQV